MSAEGNRWWIGRPRIYSKEGLGVLFRNYVPDWKGGIRKCDDKPANISRTIGAQSYHALTTDTLLVV
jgi:hypothetical protein